MRRLVQLRDANPVVEADAHARYYTSEMNAAEERGDSKAMERHERLAQAWLDRLNRLTGCA